MIAAQLEKANDAARQAEIKMLSGADLSKKAAAEGTTDADIEGALASAVRAGQDAVRLLESVKLYRQYAAYYREVEETHKS
jgi:triosephosphate isomerase